MRTSDFDYYLPQDMIAQSPVEPRDSSRLMSVDRVTRTLDHQFFYNIVDLLKPGDLLVVNDSRVIPARLKGHRVPSGGRIEILLLNNIGPGTWKALVSPVNGVFRENISISMALLDGWVLARVTEQKLYILMMRKS